MKTLRERSGPTAATVPKPCLPRRAILQAQTSIPAQRDHFSCGYNSVARCAAALGMPTPSYAAFVDGTPMRLGPFRGPLWPRALVAYSRRQSWLREAGVRYERPHTWEQVSQTIHAELKQGHPVIILMTVGKRAVHRQFRQHYVSIMEADAHSFCAVDTNGSFIRISAEQLRHRSTLEGPILGLLRGLGIYRRYNLITFAPTDAERPLSTGNASMDAYFDERAQQPMVALRSYL